MIALPLALQRIGEAENGEVGVCFVLLYQSQRWRYKDGNGQRLTPISLFSLSHATRPLTLHLTFLVWYKGFEMKIFVSFLDLVTIYRLA